jgi:hypothetical protein
LSGAIPESVLSDLRNGISNGIGFVAADYIADLPDSVDEDTKDRIQDQLWDAALTEFSRTRTLAKTAGNLGEELNPFMLDDSKDGWEAATRALQESVEDTTDAVSSLVLKSLARTRGVSRFHLPETTSLYRAELRDNLIKAIREILPD